MQGYKMGRLKGVHREEEMMGQRLKFNHTEKRALLEHKYVNYLEEDFKLRSLVSYVGNKKEPILRWFRYKESFSVSLVKHLIKKMRLNGRDVVLDPFCGMGTTPFTCKYQGIPSIGVDYFPLAVFISKVVTNLEEIDIKDIKRKFSLVEDYFKKAQPDLSLIADIPIVHKGFSRDRLEELTRWKQAIQKIEAPYNNLFLLLLLATLEEVSNTSKDGQFLRLVKKKNLPETKAVLRKKIAMAVEDLIKMRNLHVFPKIIEPEIFQWDSRRLRELKFSRTPTAVITSPPYLNRYDYSRSYALELALSFVKDSEALIKLRKRLLRSHIESVVNENETPPLPVIGEVLKALNQKRLNNPKIPDMILGYFRDMDEVIRELSIVLAEEAKLAVVVGNVRFEGEIVPVDLILSELASKYGFKTKKIIISRYKGNSSQQMKKYGRVKVRESILIWELQKQIN